MNEKMLKALNAQFSAEYYSSYFYLAMSAWFEEENLPGMASWMKAQSQEELTHAMKFFDFIHMRGGKVTLGKIDAPKAKFKSVGDVFRQGLEHERHVTSLIDSLMKTAVDTGDNASQNFLQWFVAEQVEEEASFEEVIAKVEMGGESGAALLFLDSQLGSRGAGAPGA